MIKRKLFRRPPVPKNSLEDTHLVYQTKKSSLDDCLFMFILKISLNLFLNQKFKFVLFEITIFGWG